MIHLHDFFLIPAAIDVIYFFHFRKNIAIIAAVVSVTTIILIVAIILVLWKSKSITDHKCYLIYFVWGKQSKSFPKWLSVNDKVDDQTLHASKTVHAESTI